MSFQPSEFREMVPLKRMTGVRLNMPYLRQRQTKHISKAINQKSGKKMEFILTAEAGRSPLADLPVAGNGVIRGSNNLQQAGVEFNIS
jgi:hypothetical protein